jgi:2Fe-2S ferredoxin
MAMAERLPYSEKGNSMPEVVILPNRLMLEVEDGESVAEAAWRQGWTWPTTCWGQAECTVCWVTVEEGEVSPLDAEEDEALQSSLSPHLLSDGVRLACRLYVRGGGVVLRKKGVRPPAGQG